MKTFIHFEESAQKVKVNNHMQEQDEILRTDDPLKAADRILYLLLVLLITTSFFLL